MDNRTLGRIGENAAAEFLQRKGYRVINRNYRCKQGEIDIIAQRGSELDFIEVKTRQGADYGRPCEAVTWEKKNHIKNAAQQYMNQSREYGYYPAKVRFHVIEIVVEHIEDAF